jgi:hypothetical protein
MEPKVLKIYLGELFKQCFYVANAIDILNQSIHRMSPDISKDFSASEKSYWTNEVFRSAHSFMAHLSNVARLLCPAGAFRREGEAEADFSARSNRVSERARALGAAVGLTIEESRLGDVMIRDHEEHFDEFLDDWVEAADVDNCIDNKFGKAGDPTGSARLNILRQFDGETNKFYYRGEAFDFQELAQIVEGLIPKVKRALDDVTKDDTAAK